MILNEFALNEFALNEPGVEPVFLSTPPAVPPVSVTLMGTEKTAQPMPPAANLFQASGGHESVVVDIATPQTPKHGAY